MLSDLPIYTLSVWLWIATWLHKNVKYLAIIIAGHRNYIKCLQQMVFTFGYTVTYGQKTKVKIPGCHSVAQNDNWHARNHPCTNWSWMSLIASGRTDKKVLLISNSLVRIVLFVILREKIGIITSYNDINLYQNIEIALHVWMLALNACRLASCFQRTPLNISGLLNYCHH